MSALQRVPRIDYENTPCGFCGRVPSGRLIAAGDCTLTIVCAACARDHQATRPVMAGMRDWLQRQVPRA